MKRLALLPLLALSALSATGFAQNLYIADSGGTQGVDKLWSFSAFDGSLVSNNVFTDANLVTFTQAFARPNGNILVLDGGTASAGSGIYEYSPAGVRLRTLVSDQASFGNLRTGAVRGDSLYFSAGAGTAEGTIQRVDLTTGAISLFASPPSGSTTAKSDVWGMAFSDEALYITNYVGSSNNRVQRLNLDGTFGADLVVQGATGGLRFPEQLSLDTDGDLLVAGFSGSPITNSGLYEFSTAGAQKSFVNVSGGNRGVARLGDGGLLTTVGTRVVKVNADGTISDIVNNPTSSFRYITPTAAPVPEPATLAALGIGALALLRRHRRKG